MTEQRKQKRQIKQFDTIRKGEGVLSARRQSKRPNSDTKAALLRLSKRGQIALGVLILGVVCVIWIVACAFLSPSTSLESSSTLKKVEVTTGTGTILYDDYLYQVAVASSGDGYAFTRTKTGEVPTELFTFEGEPAGLVLYKDAFLLAVNNGESHKVFAWTIGDGSEKIDLSGSDGLGAITACEVSGTQLVLTLENGKKQAVALC